MTNTYDSIQRKCNKVISECEEHDEDRDTTIQKLMTLSQSK